MVSREYVDPKKCQGKLMPEKEVNDHELISYLYRTIVKTLCCQDITHSLNRSGLMKHLVTIHRKGSTINHLGGGRGADFRERNFFFRQPSERNFFCFGDPLNVFFIFFGKIDRRNFFFFDNMV